MKVNCEKNGNLVIKAQKSINQPRQVENIYNLNFGTLNSCLFMKKMGS